MLQMPHGGCHQPGPDMSMPCGAGNGLTKEFATAQSQPSKEHSRDNCEEGSGKPPHPLPSQETWQQNSQGKLWRWTMRPSEHSAVPIPFGLFCPFQADLMKQLS